MTRFTLALVLALGCSGDRQSAPQPSAPSDTGKQGATARVAPAESKEPAESQPLPPWDPNTRVNYKALKTRHLFVVSERTSVCPTPEQAKARECGNTIEDVSKGRSYQRGHAILVVGEAPVDGLWRAIRFQKAGTLPSWVRADDLGETPKLPALDDFDARTDLKKAVDGASLSAADIAKLKKGTLVVWRRHKGIRFGVSDRLYAPGKTGVVTIHCDEKLQDYMDNHGCLVNADCLDLDYMCEKDGYCDQVSILARVTGKTSAKPEDEYKVWPAAWTSNKLPLLEAVALADRFGIYATK